MRFLLASLALVSVLAGCDKKTASEKRSCEEIASRFQEVLGQAKSCDPAADECTKLVAGDLACGCPTLVNASRQTANADVNQVVQEHVKGGCPVAECKCRTPKSATCKAQPNGKGRCDDDP